MKHKYLICILCVCVLMSVTGCGIGADTNAQAENRSEDNADADAQAENRSEDNKDADAQSEADAETEVTLPENDQEEYTEGDYYEESTVLEEEYSNPIDAYFLPRIKSASSQVEYRELQDTYRGVWKTEFENVMVWMQDKCVYQEDKDNLLLFEESVESLIDTTQTVLLTDWLDDYELPPDSANRNSWGNGTRSALNQIRAEIYRDASMKLIDHSYDTYIFMERDYSLEHYE